MIDPGHQIFLQTSPSQHRIDDAALVFCFFSNKDVEGSLLPPNHYPFSTGDLTKDILMLRPALYLAFMFPAIAFCQEKPLVFKPVGDHTVLHQDILQNTRPPFMSEAPGLDKTERLLYLSGAVVGFSVFDYIGFNATKGDRGSLIAYRVVQTAVQGLITWFLVEKCGWRTALSFNIIWWTFGMDFLYYGIAESEVLRLDKSWEGKGILKQAVMDNGAQHAWWTPAGLVQPGRPVSGQTLILQSLIGLSVSIAIF